MNDVHDLRGRSAELIFQQTQRAFQDVGARSLNRRILAVALRHRNLLAIGRVKIESHQSPRRSARLLFADRAIRRFAQIRVQPSICREVAPKDILGFTHAQPGHHRKALRANAVNDAEV